MSLSLPQCTQDTIHSGSDIAGRSAFGPNSLGLKCAKLCNLDLSLQIGMNPALEFQLLQTDFFFLMGFEVRQIYFLLPIPLPNGYVTLSR